MIPWLPTRRMNGVASLERWTEHWNKLLLWFTGKTGSWTLEFGGGICCQSESDICRWGGREADLYKLKLCKFLWPLHSVTILSGIQGPSKREMLVFLTEWLESFFSQACRPAFLAAFGKNLANLVFAERRHLVPSAFSMPSVVVFWFWLVQDGEFRKSWNIGMGTALFPWQIFSD